MCMALQGNAFFTYNIFFGIYRNLQIETTKPLYKIKLKNIFGRIKTIRSLLPPDLRKYRGKSIIKIFY